MLKAIGVGVNEWQVCHEALEQRDFDCFLLAGRYTLLEQEALDEFLPLCEERGAAVVLGGGFNSGILATGAVPGAKYNYGPAPAAVMERARRIEAVCARHDVPLKAVALQFVLAHPAIPTNIPGTRTVGADGGEPCRVPHRGALDALGRPQARGPDPSGLSRSRLGRQGLPDAAVIVVGQRP